jgi:predicted AlkP superfamily pyrophosphatase or phosphodiesterase
MDVALRVLQEEDPDFSLINLPDVDGFSHLHGRGTPTQIAAVVTADQQIQRLVDYLKASGKWQHSSVIVTADHNFGGLALPTNRVFLEPLFEGAGEAPFQVVTSGGFASVFLTGDVQDDGPLTNEQNATLEEIRTRALATPGIDEALYRLPNNLDDGTAHTVETVHPNWNLNTPRAGELMVTADEAYTMYRTMNDSSNVLLGEHGRPTDRHVPFIVLSGGTYVRDQVTGPPGTLATEADDTGAFPDQAELVDIAPTIAWMLNVDAPPGSEGRILNGPADAFAKHPLQAQRDGDITEPIANRAAIFIYDQNNSVMVNCLVRRETCAGEHLPARIHDDDFVPTLVALADNGTLTRYGSIASFPSVTFPNHNVVGSGAHPGHHGIPNNRFYIRETGVTEKPIDPNTAEHPLYHFSAGLLSQDVETLHEAVHRTYGNWKVGEGSMSANAFTASVNEPSARGADYATLEPTDTEDGTAQDGDAHPSYPNPESYAPTANPADQAQDVTQACAEESPDHYFVESSLDWLGQTQARRLFDSNMLYGHPLPKYLINNFPLTDGSGHEFGPHTMCTFAAYRDSDRRLTRILGAMNGAGVLGETLIVVTGDHGGENVAMGRKGQPSDLSTLIDDDDVADKDDTEDIKHVMADWQVYLRTLDVEASPPTIVPDQPQTITFTVTDDDLNADGSVRPIQGATVTIGEVRGERAKISGVTNPAGQVTLTFTPVTDTILASTTAPGFNFRDRGFGPLGPIDEGTPAPAGFGGGIGGLCPGLENVLGLHIVGSARDDELTGTSGRDVMCGGGGDDTVRGLGGEDFLLGGDGNDEVAPGDGNDEAFGNEGVDLVDYADAGSKVTVDLRTPLATGAGQDTIGGFQGARGGRAGDTLIGDDTANRLLGGKGKDVLSGLGGRDRLAGGPGRDRLKGGKGKDRMSGGPGRDRCKGGPGKDRAARCERGERPKRR